MIKIVATTSMPAVDRPNTDRWNAARSCQYFNKWNVFIFTIDFACALTIWHK